MEIEIGSAADGKITVVRLRGRIVDGPPAEELQRALQGLTREEKVNTIVDLEEVTWFDSLAIGLLVSHYVSCANRGGKVLLFKAGEKIQSLMGMTRLADRFGWASELDDALAWFEGS